MAVLTDQQRFETWAQYMRENAAPIAVSKPDLRAAVDAIDTYLNDNAAAINSAIPQPARSALTTVQKALLLTAVVAKRYIVGV